MKFREIISGHYKVFSRQKEDERLRNIQIIKYIESIASMAGIDVMDWDAKEMFGTGTGHKFIDDRNEINRRFFERVEQMAKEADTAVEADLFLSQESKTALKALETRHIATLVAQEEQKSLRYLNDARSYYRQHEELLQKAAEHGTNARRLSRGGVDLETQIKTIVNSKFWSFAGITEGSKLSFVSNGDIVCTHKNPAAGIDITFNFGRFKVIFNCADFTLKVIGIERNTVVNGHVHPHIGSGGGICWGSASDQATRQIASGSIVEPMLLLSTVLTNYNSGNPYQAIEKFQEKLGSPEDIARIAGMNARREEIQESLAPLDSSELDVDAYLTTESIEPMNVTDEARQLIAEREAAIEPDAPRATGTSSYTVTVTPILGA